MPIERTNAEMLGRARPHGGGRPADRLGEQLQRGDIKPGDLVALSGISIGMRWYCTLVRV